MLLYDDMSFQPLFHLSVSLISFDDYNNCSKARIYICLNASAVLRPFREVTISVRFNWEVVVDKVGIVH